MTTQTLSSLIHRHFEMGTAPYRYVGLWSSPSAALAEANPRAYNNALTGAPACCRNSCDHCGTGITHHCIIQDADGQRFAVGSDCLGKIDDVENLSQAEADRKAHQSALRKSRAEVKRQAEREEAEAKLQSERDLNGGLTDWELTQKTRQDVLSTKREVTRERFDYFLTALKESGGDFGRGMVRSIEDNECTPTGSGLYIMMEITAKHYSGSRVNSKAFKASLINAYSILEAILNSKTDNNEYL
jgi:hypothetical protein